MKLLSRREPRVPDSRADSVPAHDEDDVESGFLPSSLVDEYALTIHSCLIQQGVEHGELRVSVRTVGASPSGMDVYAGFIKVLRWTPPVRALVVQMPWVERRIERRLRQTGLLQYSHFGGLWFRSPALLTSELPRSGGQVRAAGMM